MHRGLAGFRAFGAQLGASGPPPTFPIAPPPEDGSEPRDESTPSSTPSGSVLGRRRREDDEDIDDPRSAKRYELFAIRIAHQHGIPPESIVAFSKVRLAGVVWENHHS